MNGSLLLRSVMVFLWLGGMVEEASSAAAWRIGFGKVDITPVQSVRLSGYASRNESNVGVADPLFARAMVLSPADSSPESNSVLLISIDSIGTTNSLTLQITDWLRTEYQIPRSQVAISSTHSHAAPHLEGGLQNLFTRPSDDAQTKATQEYSQVVVDKIREVVKLAMANRQVGKLSIGEDKATFAVNRRLLKEGKWSGFGVQPDGQVDHRVRAMRASAPDGKLLGCFFVYACHCTTLGGDFNQVSGDWAGLAAGQLEKLHPESVFIPVIGCGADQNPNPRNQYEQHAMEMVDSVSRAIQKSNAQFIDDFPITKFGYVGLAPEQPTDEYLAKMSESSKPNEQRWSAEMKRIRKEMGRLPESYPMPIHTWQFGDQLTCVFLGGEVVVDYQFRIEKELPTKQTWVVAYTDDVFAYVASEKMRSENGYEVDFSMIYYLQPGRWQSGTQSLITQRVVEIFRNQLSELPPLSSFKALETIRVPEGFRVDIVADESMVQDPINVAFGPDGRVWVVEMNDYPLGAVGGGRVKILTDTDGDSKLDAFTVFVEGLAYPTGVYPWRDGAIVISAPDVFFAADRNDDGMADFRETLLTGFSEANPQHRANGFEIGLDGWLHMGTGTGTKKIKSQRNGKEYEVSNRDIAWNPETGEIRPTSGETQFVRSRDAFGNWFGNSNSEPMFQYAIESRYSQNSLLGNEAKNHLLKPSVAPPVFPRSLSLDRFNDLHTLNRYTSACSSIVSRVPGINIDGEVVGFIAEPVHNLVARIQILDDGSTLSAVRHPEDGQYDFFTSTDSTSRPVRVVNAPDGSIWIVDMVRQVIEHPEWIPTSWQQRIDLRAGSKLGRIYRVYRDNFKPTRLAVIGKDANAIVSALSSNNGAIRDLALSRILTYDDETIALSIRQLAYEHSDAAVRVSALGCLSSREWLTTEDLNHTLQDRDARLVRFGLELCESVKLNDALQDRLEKLPSLELGRQVDLQWILTTNLLSGLDVRSGLKTLAYRSKGDAWIGKSLSLVRHPERVRLVLEAVLDAWTDADLPGTRLGSSELDRILTPLWKQLSTSERIAFMRERFDSDHSIPSEKRTFANLVCLSLASRSREPIKDEPNIREFASRARERMMDPSSSEQERVTLASLIGGGCYDSQTELSDAEQLLRNDGPTQLKNTVLVALRSIDSEQIPSLVLSNWSRFNTTLRNSACNMLLTRPHWARELVYHLEKEQVAAADLEPALVQHLTSQRDRSLRSRCIALFGKSTPRDEVVAKFLAEMPTPTLAAEGTILYSANCKACHDSVDNRPAIGPPLQNLNHWTMEQWVTAIMHPNRNVDAKYQQAIVLLNSDATLPAIILEETSSSIKLALADGSIRELAAETIAEIKKTSQSLMPEGFENKLSPSQLATLIGFLRQRAPEMETYK
jgi:putative membrane-bound dehydrogenase-like protein